MVLSTHATKVLLYALLAASYVAGRVLTQASSPLTPNLGIDFDICYGSTFNTCCLNFDFGVITPDPLKLGKAFPSNTICNATSRASTPVLYRPKPTILQSKTDLIEYVEEPREIANVTVAKTTTWNLVKFEPPFNVWATAAAGFFCICPNTTELTPAQITALSRSNTSSAAALAVASPSTVAIAATVPAAVVATINTTQG